MTRVETNNVVERLPDKIKSRVKVCDDGCWRWQGWIDPQGYGYCYYEGKRRSIHRLSYQILVGPIPSDLVCDHLCCVRNCLNPAHIELVTSGINVLRGHERRKIAGRPALNLRNHCRKGHEFTPENTFMHWRGRTCRTCQYASQQRYRRKVKAEGRRDKIVELERQVTVLSDRIDGLQDTIVTLWHQAPSEDRSLHECLGMTFDEYSAWANPTASLTQEGKTNG
jgi:hypothetical protein